MSSERNFRVLITVNNILSIKEHIELIDTVLKGVPKAFWDTSDATNIIALIGEATVKLQLARALIGKTQEASV